MLLVADTKPTPGPRGDLVPRLRRTFWLGALALAAVGATFVALEELTQRNVEWILQSRELMRMARNARLLAIDQEAGLQQYRATQRLSALAPEAAARQAFLPRMDSVISFTAAEPVQAARARKIRADYVRWSEGYVRPALRLSARSELDEPAVASGLSELQGRQLYTQIREGFETLIRAEEARYAARVTRDRFLRRVMLSAVLLELALAAAVFAWLRRRVVGQAAELVQQQNDLEQQTIELETQAEALEEQALQLEDQADAARESARSTETANRELSETILHLERAQSEAATASKQREDTLHLLNVVLESAPVGFALFDRNLRFVRVNRTFAETTGILPEKHIGRTIPELLPGRIPFPEALLKTVLDTGQPVMNAPATLPATEHERERHWNGNSFPVRGHAGAVDQVGVLLMETTEHRLLGEQLLQSQKMEAVGRLAGGVAHDFNNILTAVMSYSELLLEDLPPGDRRREDVLEIRRAADRAESLTRQLLAFSRQEIAQPRVLNLNDAVSSCEKMLRRLIGADIELVTRLDPKPTVVQADTGQIEQVLMNLVVNARDAMPDGGRLIIRTANVALTEDYASRHSSATAGPHVMLSVSDTGAGMTRDTQQRIFEPFFTTKVLGKGTGLGLSTVYGIVKQSNGHIWVYSEPGQGSAFKIYLPSVAADPQEVSGSERPRQTGGSETILLVEDEDSVRVVTQRVLRHAGYAVRSACNGNEALAICESDAEPVDLLITDVVMPDMGGIELAKRLQQIWPTTMVLFMSGYTEDAMARKSVLHPDAGFLEKPFTLATLMKKARDLLDSRDASREAAPVLQA